MNKTYRYIIFSLYAIKPLYSSLANCLSCIEHIAPSYLIQHHLHSVTISREDYLPVQQKLTISGEDYLPVQLELTVSLEDYLSVQLELTVSREDYLPVQLELTI